MHRYLVRRRGTTALREAEGKRDQRKPPPNQIGRGVGAITTSQCSFRHSSLVIIAGAVGVSFRRAAFDGVAAALFHRERHEVIISAELNSLILMRSSRYEATHRFPFSFMGMLAKYVSKLSDIITTLEFISIFQRFDYFSVDKC
ncbi:hypothetical protein WA026_017435 [Henosepilachna vigintioctopunctata]|uniref:Uncharacterized protein n=1 Tax=Henosepilachna vigintioctopunctata TaxID=420089 RepID=A0AAW1VG06_9CUCU